MIRFSTMNEQQLVKSEQIASKIMRALAIIGLVSILAIIAWLIVQGFRLAPNSGEKMGAAVSSLTSFFRGGPEESLTLATDTKTMNVGAPTELRFVYTGGQTPTSYQFSYTCSEGVHMSVQTSSGVRELACATPLSFEDARATITFVSTKSRYADVELAVTTGALKDTISVTVVNPSLTLSATATSTATSTTATTSTKTVKKTTPTPSTTAKPVRTPATRPVQTPVVVRTPADLAVNILETGLLVRVHGQNTLVSVSPVPSNKTAAVTFTVANRGGTPSSAWAFVANLPIEGDTDYRYVSPAQPSLAPGAEIEFTLGFDDVAEAKTGTIKIELVPTNKSDSKNNNTDAVRLDIKKV
jgi:hypothetical protein